MAVYVRTSGDFDALDDGMRENGLHRLVAFADRYAEKFHEVELHAHVKASGSHGNALMRCNLNLFTEQRRFHVQEEAHGLDAVMRRALLSLRQQLEKHLEMDAAREHARQPAMMEH